MSIECEVNVGHAGRRGHDMRARLIQFAKVLCAHKIFLTCDPGHNGMLRRHHKIALCVEGAPRHADRTQIRVPLKDMSADMLHR